MIGPFLGDALQQISATPLRQSRMSLLRMVPYFRYSHVTLFSSKKKLNSFYLFICHSQTYLVQLAVSDGLLCTVGTVTVALDGTTPSYEVTESTYPSDGILGVPIRGTTSINLIVLGICTPLILCINIFIILFLISFPFYFFLLFKHFLLISFLS